MRRRGRGRWGGLVEEVEDRDGDGDGDVVMKGE